jgi:tetratricopeptide (TPR) repeat protein
MLPLKNSTFIHQVKAGIAPGFYFLRYFRNFSDMKNLLIVALLLQVLLVSCGEKKTDAGQKAAVTDTTPDGIRLQKLTAQIAAEPSNVSLLHERARLLISMKNYEPAVADMQKVLAMDTTKAGYYLTMADISFAANRSYDAKGHLEHALRIDPENTEAMMRLAELNLIVRQYAASVNLLNKILEKDKSNTTAWLMRGINFKENGDTVRAINDFRSAVEADPSYYEAYMQLGILYQLKNDPISEGYFTNAIKLRPNSEEALYGRGLWYQEHDKLDKAIQDYTSIVQINPKNKNAHFNLGYIHHIYLKIYPEAAKHYSNAILADPKYAEAYYNRGLCLEAVGNTSDAANDFRMAMTIRPNYVVAEEGLKRVSGK